MLRSLFVPTMLLILPSGAFAQVESQTRDMDFDQCLSVIRQLSSDLGVAPINVVETNILRIVRFNTSDGSVLISCSEPDRKLVITTSPHRG